MGHRTPIYAAHVEAGAKIVDFGGWDMPIHYGSQIEEHHAVRKEVGMCDVSHMTVVDLGGAESGEFLKRLLANDVSKLAPGKALYSTMLNDAGGIIDDLIVYSLGEDYRLVVNCATREKDLAWIDEQARTFDVVVTERPELAIIAVQGPRSLPIVKDVLGATAATLIDSLKPFTAAFDGDTFIARTGYTGEQGVEIILPGEKAESLWQRLDEAGVRPVGLGARDTLRLEAGMNLYGSDMDETVTPAESNLSWTVSADTDRDFIGKAAIAGQESPAELVGLVLEQRGVIRSHYKIFAGEREIGEVTSGAFSPTLQHSIAFARIERDVAEPLSVEIRGKKLPVTRVRPPFVRNGKRVYKNINE